MEHVTVDLISTKEFSRVSKGYDPREVDEFLDDICDEMERMEAEITLTILRSITKVLTWSSGGIKSKRWSLRKRL